MAIAICTEPSCEQIFSGAEIKVADLWQKDGVLPCGHKPALIIMAASSIRNAFAARDRLEQLEARLRNLGRIVCDSCGNKFCHDYGRPFSGFCQRGWK